MNGRHRFWRPERWMHVGRRLIASTRGATAMEYALLAAMVAVVLVSALGSLGEAITDLPMAALITAFASVLP